MIITIDGPVATGKTTIAKKVADSIGFVFFDTGAMYRTLTYALLKEKVDLNDLNQLKIFLETFDLDIKLQKHCRAYFYKNTDVTKIIRKSEVSSRVSEISAIKEVREKINSMIKALAKGVNAVFEGRDMGSVVFPDADLKIFLTGRNEVRAQRRYEEMLTKFPKEKHNFSFERCLKELLERDHYDSTRENDPLIQPEDAYVIDTSDFDVSQVVFKIMECFDAQKAKLIIPSPPRPDKL